MHALTVATAPRTATVRGPSRAVLLVLVPVALAAVVVAAPVQPSDLTVPSVGDAASAVWSAHLPARSPCGPLPAELPPVEALGVRLDCHGSVLAARARALEFNPVR
ncbi:hypothetical protein ACFUC1_00380 [Pedococcus sp. NPDC057267]|uniref:hypothetical protein n=1 Tax=Pedococcus sp. NPDC057267 TaxID=3346077 RepID=UPI003644A6A3